MTTESVSLRAVTEADVETFYEHQADPEASEMAAFPSRERAEHGAHWRKILADDSVVARTILCGTAVAGNAVSWIQDGHREVGYWIGRDHWGRGVATRALSQFLDVVDERPLEAYVAEHNAASARVLEKCGFMLEGTLEEGEVTRLVYVLR